MAKPFSEMTPIERHINRWRLSEGLPANYTERDAKMTMGYDDAGLRRAMRLAIDEAKTDLLAREQALRSVERVLPQYHFEDKKTAQEVYLAALEAIGGIKIEEIRHLDATSLAGIFKIVTDSLRTGNHANLAQHAQDESPRARLARSDLAALSPNFARIIVNRD